MKNFFAFSSILLVSIFASAGPGGGSVVGDGGSTVYCPGKKKDVLFDLYEERLISGSREVTLNANGGSLKAMVYTGLDRINSRFSLTEAEQENITKMFRALNSLPLDPWIVMEQMGHAKFSGYLRVNPVITTAKVAASLASGKCKLKVAIINPHAPNIKPATRKNYERICELGYADFEFCLLRNSRTLAQLEESHFACLIVHEALRFLPASKAPVNEFQLRRTTASICTQ